MAHELEIVNGEASMAYNVNSGTPWHRLGTPVDGQQTADEMLRIAKADYDVELLPVYIMGADGEPQEIPERFATTRIDHDGNRQAFEVFKSRYSVMNNRPVLDKALAVVTAAEQTETFAIVDTLGVLKEGREFFATIDLGSLVIDPLGASDKIARYLLVHTSHDGTAPISYANTDIRAVCANTVRFGQQHARSVFKARHTPNVEATLDEARQQLEFSLNWAEAFKVQAEELMRVDIPANSYKVDRVLDNLWPIADADTDRKVHNRDEVVQNIRHRYSNERNAGKVGYNGWGFYNSIVEYFDHGRSGTPTRRAMASMDSTSLPSQRKVQAQEAILALN